MATGFRVQIRRDGGKSAASKETERNTKLLQHVVVVFVGRNILSLTQDPGAVELRGGMTPIQ